MQPSVVQSETTLFFDTGCSADQAGWIYFFSDYMVLQLLGYLE